MRRLTTPAILFALLCASLGAAAPAPAALQPVGHEFRPSVEQRAGTDPCVASDGSNVAVVFHCDETSPGYCSNPSKGKLYGEWRTPEGELASDPVLIADGYYSYGPPYSCAADGTLMLVLDEGLRVVGPEGVRATVARICDTDASCWGPFGVSASQGGFLVFWFDYGRGLLGRFYDIDGGSPSASFVISEVRTGYLVRQGLLLPGGDVLIAWRGPHGEPSIYATLVGNDGTVEPAIEVSEFAQVQTNGDLRLGIEDDDLLLVTWDNAELQAGWVARHLTTGDLPPSTTTTTLESATPDFMPAIEIGTSAVGDGQYHTDVPQLAGDDEGRWIASWVDRVLQDGNDVLGTESATSTVDGYLWSAPQPLHATDYPHARANSIAGDGHGTTIDAWARRSGAGILFRRSTDGGQTWSDPAVLYDNPLRPEYEEDYFWGSIDIRDVTVVGRGSGNWLAVWSESVEAYDSCDPPSDDCPDYESRTILCAIRAAHSNDGGVTWSEPSSIEPDKCYDVALRVAGGGEGDWLVVWPHEEWYEPAAELRGAWSTDGGQQWSPAQTLLPDLAFGFGLSLAGNAQGQWVVAFAQSLFDPLLPWPDSQYERIFVSRTDDLSATWSVPAAVAPWHDASGGPDRFPSVAAGDDGRFGLAWTTHWAGSGLDADIVMSVSDDAGESWSVPRLVDDLAAKDARADLSPRLVGVGSTWAVAWRSLGDPRILRFARTRGDCGNGDVEGVETCDDGNGFDGDGCDSTCIATGCGSLIVTDGEDCDDGNTSDSDECVSCSTASCGDGFVRDGVEQCDDANSIDTDDCLNICTVARCGDGVARPGIEACDDGDASGNNDACLAVCAVAQCGDGYLELGEEECDDGNLAGGDGCTAGCMLEGSCGLLNRDGLRVKASDAAKVLRRAVGFSVRCPLRNCDVNGDGKVAALDALSTLRSAVGLLPEGCSWPTNLVVRMTTGEKLGALQIEVRYADAAGYVPSRSNGKPDCTNLVPSSSFAIGGDGSEGEFRASFISLDGIQGPLDLLRCKFDPVSGPSLHDFTVEIQDASNVHGQPVEPPPVVTVTAE